MAGWFNDALFDEKLISDHGTAGKPAEVRPAAGPEAVKLMGPPLPKTRAFTTPPVAVETPSTLPGVATWAGVSVKSTKSTVAVLVKKAPVPTDKKMMRGTVMRKFRLAVAVWLTADVVLRLEAACAEKAAPTMAKARRCFANFMGQPFSEKPTQSGPIRLYLQSTCQPIPVQNHQIHHEKADLKVEMTPKFLHSLQIAIIFFAFIAICKNY